MLVRYFLVSILIFHTKKALNVPLIYLFFFEVAYAAFEEFLDI